MTEKIRNNLRKFILPNKKMSKQRITLHFEPHHAKKLLSGKGVCQLSHTHLAGRKGVPIEVDVPRHVATRLRKASQMGKASRVRMDEMGGEGIKEWFQNLGRKIKDGYEKIKPAVAPLVKQGVGRLVDMGADVAKPFLPSQVNQLIQDNKGKAVDFIGQQTGAYGLLPVYGGSVYPVYGYGAVPMAVHYPQPIANWSTQAMPLSASMISKIPYSGFGMPAGTIGQLSADTSGGSFKAI